MKITFKKHILNFSFPAGTSRGSLNEKTSYIIYIENNKTSGYGEISLIPKLSPDINPSLEDTIKQLCHTLSETEIPKGFSELNTLLDTHIPNTLPAVRFGFETAFLDLMNGGNRTIFKTKFSEGKEGIDINGLIWMGDESFMLKQIDEKINKGFSCIKMKIGAIDYIKELAILQTIRKEYSKQKLTLRVDSNGAFNQEQAKEVLNDLAQLDIHSIEQPIKAGNISDMAELCSNTPTPIALDEELIGINNKTEKKQLLKHIKPQYIILKPSLLGGLQKTSEWIEIAHELDIKWWITSALEGNIGLNAIAQYTSNIGYTGHQGLGTGQLFTNNITSPLEIEGEKLWYNNSSKWKL